MASTCSTVPRSIPMSRSIRSLPLSLAASTRAALVLGWRRLLRLSATWGDANNATDPAIERPWLARWDHLPKRSAGPGFSLADYAEARRRAREVARATLGEELWADLQRRG